MKPPFAIRLLAIVLIVFFGLSAAAAIAVSFTVAGGVDTLLAAVTHLGFVAGGIGLLKLRRWAWWLTLLLCGVSLAHLLWQVFASLTPETATKRNELIAYAVAGAYLAMGFYLTCDSVRKAFRNA